MNQSEFNKAMSYIDDDIVECFLINKSNLGKKVIYKNKTRTFLRWGAVAAMFCLVFSATLIIVKHANQGAEPNLPGFDQIIDNITEDTTEKVNEDTTDVGEEDTSDIVIDQLGLPAPIDEIIWCNPDDSGVSSESFGMYWNGLLLADELYEAINKAGEDKYFAMYFFYYGKYDVDTNAFLLDLFKEHCLVEKNGTIYVFATKSEIANFDANALKDYQICFAKKSVFVDVPPPTFSQDIFVTDFVTGFAYNKIYIRLNGSVDSTPNSDEEVISMLNETIDICKYTHDSIEFYFYHDGSLTEEEFKGMNYSDICIPKYYPREVVIVTVKYEDINIKAIRDISNMDEIYSIHISPPLVGSPE